MKGFFFAVLMLILILALGMGFIWTGFVNMRADNPPSKMETTLAGHAMDASVARAAPDLTNPVISDEANLTAGARVYRDRCSLCHGDPAHPKSPLATSFSPPAPQFMTKMADMPQNQNFYIVEHGIRWTGMPAWKNILSEQQVWQTVTFLSKMHELPPAPLQVFTESPPRTQSSSSTN
jgi:mono/diheme cytochrome c family protein